MSDSIVLTPLAPNDLPMLEQWYKNPLLHTYGGSNAPKKLLTLIAMDPHRHCWIAKERGEPIGFVELEIAENHIGWIGLVVNPALHNQQCGRHILHSLLKQPEVHPLEELRAGIEPNNTPSIRCFMAAGFTSISEKPDHEGILNFRYALRQTEKGS